MGSEVELIELSAYSTIGGRTLAIDGKGPVVSLLVETLDEGPGSLKFGATLHEGHGATLHEGHGATLHEE